MNFFLKRIRNIFYDNHSNPNDSNNFKFTQSTYSNTNPPSFEYLHTTNSNNYGEWGSTEINLFTVSSEKDISEIIF